MGRRALPHQLIKRLGSEPDTALASRFQVSTRVIRRLRHRHGIPVFCLNFTWTQARLQSLGTRTDTELARRWKVSPYVVKRRRHVDGIPPFNRSTQGIKTTPLSAELRDALATMSNSAIHRQLGMGLIAIQALRRQWNIPVNPESRRHLQWTAPMLADLGHMSDDAFHEKYHVAVSTVVVERRRRGIPAFKKPSVCEGLPTRLLGTMADTDFGKRFGISKTAARAERMRHGIAPFDTSPPWTTLAIPRLGRESDGAIASSLDVFPGSVTNLRTRLGIPAFVPPPSAPPPWLPAIRHRLGRESDKLLAETAGTTVDIIKYWRKKLGIRILRIK